MTIIKPKQILLKNFSVCSFAHLFVKLSGSGDSKVTFAVFESSYHMLLPV